MTLTKIKVNHDTAVNPSAEFSPQVLFDYDYHVGTEFHVGIGSSLTETSYNISFNTNTYMRQYTVKKMKVSELFGLIGGIILFLFFGLGAFIKSFNDYRLRYLIGCRLYQLRPNSIPRIRIEREKGKKISK